MRAIVLHTDGPTDAAVVPVVVPVKLLDRMESSLARLRCGSRISREIKVIWWDVVFYLLPLGELYYTKGT